MTAASGYIWETCFFGLFLQCLRKTVTNLILNNFNKLEPISIIFAHSISRVLLQITIIFCYWTSFEFTLPSHSGANGVSPLCHLFHSVIDKAVISGVPSCVHVLSLKAIIWNICYIDVCWLPSWSNRLYSEPLTDFRGRHTESFTYCG